MKWRARTRGPRAARFRRRILTRDAYRCRRCGMAGKLEVHHIIEVSRGGSEFDAENVEVLCRDCHIRHHETDLDRARAVWRQLVRSRMI